MKLELDYYLVQHGIADIRTIKDKIVILANVKNKEKRYEIKFDENSTYEVISNSLEAKLDKPLGRELCQYIIQFICNPEKWDKIIISTAKTSLKQEAEEQQALEEKYKPKYHFDNFEQWQVAVEKAYHKLHKTVDDNIPQAWSGIEHVLSVKAILHIKEITLPYIGVI